MSDLLKFTYNIQCAGYAFKTKDEKGVVDFDTFVDVFEQFPWGEQMRQREKMAGGCSATISVVDLERNCVLWVSVTGNDRRPTFLLGSVFYKIPIKPTRIRKPRVITSSDIHIAPNRRSVLCAFRLFFTGEAIKLNKRFSSYKLFKQ